MSNNLWCHPASRIEINLYWQLSESSMPGDVLLPQRGQLEWVRQINWNPLSLSSHQFPITGVRVIAQSSPPVTMHSSRSLPSRFHCITWLVSRRAHCVGNWNITGSSMTSKLCHTDGSSLFQLHSRWLELHSETLFSFPLLRNTLRWDV